MDIIVTIQHPAHVHFFRNAIDRLEHDGHNIHVFVREKDISIKLLNEFGIEHTVLAGEADSIAQLACIQLTYEFRLLRKALEIRPDVMMAVGEPGVAHVSTLLDLKSVIFYDTEHATISNLITYPFADTICTPRCYEDDLGDKQIRYPGYQELAYLHPAQFEPSSEALKQAGVKPDDKFVVLRLNEWEAVHEFGDSGFSDPVDLVERLEATGATVFITSEMDLPTKLEQRRANIPYNKMHDLLYYADLFIGESPTMSVEAAVLGTPAVFVATTVPSNVREIADRYGLVFNYGGENRHERGIEQAISILQDGNQNQWADRRQTLLSDTVDTTDIIIKQATK